MRNTFLILFLIFFVLLFSCAEKDSPTSWLEPTTGDPETGHQVTEQSYVVTNPDSGVVTAGVDTFCFKTTYFQVVAEDDSLSIAESLLSMAQLNIMKNDSLVQWINEDSASSVLAELRITANIGDVIEVVVMNLFDNDAGLDTINLTVVESSPGQEVNNPPSVTLNVSPLEGDAPLTTEVTSSWVDPDGDDVIAYILTGKGDTLTNLVNDTTISVTYDDLGIYHLMLVVDDGKENGLVTVGHDIFVSEPEATKLIAFGTSGALVTAVREAPVATNVTRGSVGRNKASSFSKFTGDTIIVFEVPYNGTFEPGTWTMTAVLDGYETMVKTGIIIPENQTTDVTFDLVPIVVLDPAVLALTSNPNGVTAQIVSGSFNQTVVTPDDVTLPSGGEYTIYASKDGFYSDTLEVTVEDHQTKQLHITLAPVIPVDPPIVNFNAPDTAFQGVPYPIEWATSYVSSATLDGESVPVDGSVMFIPNNLGQQVHEFIAYGLDGSVVTVYDTVIIISEPLQYPNIVADPTAIDFGDIVVGSGTMGYETVTITNIGDADLDVSLIEIIGPDVDQFHVTAGSSGGILQPGQSQDVEVGFCPASVGVKFATLQIHSNDPDTPVLNISLMGAGVEESLDCTSNYEVQDARLIELNQSRNVTDEALLDTVLNGRHTLVFYAKNDQGGSLVATALHFKVAIFVESTNDTLINETWHVTGLANDEEIYCVLPDIPEPPAGHKIIIRAHNYGGDPSQNYDDMFVNDVFLICDVNGIPSARPGVKTLTPGTYHLAD